MLIVLKKKSANNNSFLLGGCIFSGRKEQCDNSAEKYKTGEITKDEYDEWRYNYPNGVEGFGKVPSKEFSDAMVKKLMDKLKDM